MMTRTDFNVQCSCLKYAKYFLFMCLAKYFHQRAEDVIPEI